MSLGVIERLEVATMDRRDETAAERTALEAALEDSRVPSLHPPCHCHHTTKVGGCEDGRSEG